METPLIIVGLGNPGSQYERTRHNLGFELVDHILREGKALDKSRQKFQGELGEVTWKGRKIYCLKPMTFMNLSGQSVGECARFYKCDVGKDLVLVVDDLDLPPGKLRLKPSGGSGGHNGIISVIEHLGTESFPRLRIGIGKEPSAPGRNHVLGKIPSGEWPLYQKSIEKAVEALKIFSADGIARAMEIGNRAESEPKKGDAE